MPAELQGEIVLVASKSPRPDARYRSLMSGFDFAKPLSNRILFRALKQIDKKAFYYDDVRTFVKNIHLHQHHLIFPYYYSIGSRIKYSYVQSICESMGIKFVGPESYALTVCNDKVLSKDICRLHGLRTPRCAVLYTENDKPALNILQPPLIVKPVFEGDSIGIAQDSVSTSYESAEGKARSLYSKIRAPVIVEEFISGTEVNVCLVQDGADGYQIRAVALNKQGDVYDYRQKHYRLPFRTYEAYTGPEIAVNLASFLNVAKMLGKLEFMRIDCIISGSKVYCIELTPDADLSINSALYRSFAGELTYTNFVRLLITNAVQSYKSRQTN